MASNRPYDLAGMRILITGAAGGIGAATAALCASLGAELRLTDRASCDEALQTAGGQGEALALDLEAQDAARELAGWAGPLDALVMATGLYQPVDWSEAGWETALEAALSVNLAAPMRLVRPIAENMAARGRGRIVLIGSIAAAIGGSFPGVGPHYAVSKGGLHTFVRWLAARYTSAGVLTNGVAPGVTDTAMVRVHDLEGPLARHPMRRAARPEEIAWPIAFLCSPGASFISGAVLDVNGGAYLRP